VGGSSHRAARQGDILRSFTVVTVLDQISHAMGEADVAATTCAITWLRASLRR
jgi:hypothetical protein